MSTTQRSLHLLLDQGYTVALTEHGNSFSYLKHDLFGMFDMIALHPHQLGVLAVQTTTKPHMKDRIKKIQKNHISRLWLQCGNRIHVHGWHQAKIRGKWTLALHDFGALKRNQ